MDILPILFGLSAVVYPAIVIRRLSQPRGLRNALVFLRDCKNLAFGTEDLVADQFKELVIGVSITGIVLDFGANISGLVTAQNFLSLLAYYLAFVVIFSASQSVIRMAERRLLVFFLGDCLGAWALVGGDLLVAYAFLLLLGTFGYVVVTTVVVVLGVVLVIAVLSSRASAEAYAGGLQTGSGGHDPG